MPSHEMVASVEFDQKSSFFNNVKQVAGRAALCLSLAAGGLAYSEFSNTPEPAFATANPQATVEAPFTGKWASDHLVYPDSNGNYNDVTSSHPSVHHRYYGDWATDIYQAATTAVKLHVVSNDGAVSFTYNRSNDSCSTVGPNLAGHGIVLNVLVNGTTIGSVDYEHLDNIPAPTSTFTNGMTIGNVTSEGFAAGCYTARHTHIELKNNNPGTYSCWADKGIPGTGVNESDSLGNLGSLNTGVQQKCNTAPPPSDIDNDSVQDTVDQCPTIPGVAANNGCPANKPPTIADVNGDGKADLLHIWSGGVNTWLANGDGTYNATNPYKPFPTYDMGGMEWKVGDFNGDGKSDLLHIWSGGLNTWISNGDGTYNVTSPFLPMAGYSMTGGFDFEVGDMNGDNKTDLVQLWSGGANTWLSNGDGTYNVSNPYLPLAGYSMTGGIGWKVGYFNNDNKADLVHLWSGGANTWLSNGNGTYNVSNAYKPAGYNMTSGIDWKVGDFDGDGKTDLLHIWNSGVNFWKSNGDGTYAVANTYLPFAGYNMTGALDWKVGDMDGDGKTDLLHIWNSGVNTWKSNGDGTFTAYNPYSPPGYSMNGGFEFTMGDANNNGKSDLIHLWNGGANTWFSNGNGTYNVPNTYLPFPGYGMTGGKFYPTD